MNSLQALIFIVDSLFQLAVYAFLLRLLLQLCRADFRNPFSQAILTLTSWLVLPLRRFLPPFGRVDTASVMALLLVQFAARFAVMGLTFQTLPPLEAVLWSAGHGLLVTVLQFYTFMIFVYALLSFVAPGTYSPVVAVLSSLCEPLLAPVRRALPPLGGLDFSPVILIIGLQALRILVA
jgi:YggT family protein